MSDRSDVVLVLQRSETAATEASKRLHEVWKSAQVGVLAGTEMREAREAAESLWTNLNLAEMMLRIMATEAGLPFDEPDWSKRAAVLETVPW